MTSDVTKSGKITAVGQTVQISTADMGTVSIDISGTWTGTIVSELTIDGTTWTTAGISALANGTISFGSLSANGTYQSNCAGCLAFRIRASGSMTGTAIITLRASTTVAVVDSYIANTIQVSFDGLQEVLVTNIANNAPGTTATDNPVQVGGVYNSSAPTPTTGQVEYLQLDSLSNLQTNLYTKIAGEDLTNDVMKTEEQFSYTNITTNTTTTVKSGAGLLKSITINKGAATGVITVYDNTAASGTIIATITMPAVLLANQIVLFYSVKFTTGLTILTATAAQDLTISWR